MSRLPTQHTTVYVSHMQLLLATTNRGKIIEIQESLQALPVTVLSPQDLGITTAPHEHGDTFEANALEKAHYYYERAKIPTLADDSGILVDALSKELGIHTRRWGAGPTASDEEWITYFLERMQREKNKRASFVCVLAYIDHTGKEHLFRGSCDGVITESLEAKYLPGLPISACFRPDGFDRVYSAMTIEQKNSTSHRGRATQVFVKYLKQSLGNPL